MSKLLNNVKSFKANSPKTFTGVVVALLIVVLGAMLYGSWLLLKTGVDNGMQYLLGEDYVVSTLEYVTVVALTFLCVAFVEIYKRKDMNNILLFLAILVINSALTGLVTLGWFVWAGLSDPVLVYPVTAIWMVLSLIILLKQDSINDSYNGEAIEGYRLLGRKLNPNK